MFVYTARLNSAIFISMQINLCISIFKSKCVFVIFFFHVFGKYNVHFA